MNYEGKLGFNGQMSGEAFRAYMIWRSQRGRCYNPKDRAFPWYGEKGIKVIYSSREFVGWWLSHDTSKFKAPCCGRIDHTKNYCFENIQMGERSENSIERHQRLPNPSIKVRVFDKNKNLLFEAKSFNEAARILKCNHASVMNWFYKKKLSKQGISIEEIK